MPWYGQFVRDSKYNSLTLWKKAFASDYVITLDEMPDLKTYVAITEEPEPPVTGVIGYADDFRVYPTKVDDSLQIEGKAVIGEVQLINTIGQPVRIHNFSGNRGVISCSGLSAGFYFIKMRNYPMLKILKK
jgi:mannan endo-1,4-beta-mannosidase